MRTILEKLEVAVEEASPEEILRRLLPFEKGLGYGRVPSVCSPWVVHHDDGYDFREVLETAAEGFLFHQGRISSLHMIQKSCALILYILSFIFRALML
mmetsp:Transcript_36620/g.67669  ORF Transcript_36620/g.67669 Transcript_36620/m.67669 type:complete len:98 (-) Transcript_36620:172-465(-)